MWVPLLSGPLVLLSRQQVIKKKFELVSFHSAVWLSGVVSLYICKNALNSSQLVTHGRLILHTVNRGNSHNKQMNTIKVNHYRPFAG